MRIVGRDDFNDVGVWVPRAGPAEYRFSPQRRIVRVEPVTAGELVTVDHPIGLPLDEVLADPHTSPVTWHYLSMKLDAGRAFRRGRHSARIWSVPGRTGIGRWRAASTRVVAIATR